MSSAKAVWQRKLARFDGPLIFGGIRLFDPPLTPEEIRQCLPDYVLERQLRRSGQGVVYSATSGKHGDVALKIYFPSEDDERVKREAGVLRALNIPTLVSLKDFGTIDIRQQSCFFTATIFEPGSDLADQLASARKLSQEEGLRLLRDVAQTIKCLWQQRIISL